MESTAKTVATSKRITNVHGHRKTPRACIFEWDKDLVSLKDVNDNLKHIQCKATHTKENAEKGQNMVQ